MGKHTKKNIHTKMHTDHTPHRATAIEHRHIRFAHCWMDKILRSCCFTQYIGIVIRKLIMPFFHSANHSHSFMSTNTHTHTHSNTRPATGYPITSCNNIKQSRNRSQRSSYRLHYLCCMFLFPTLFLAAGASFHFAFSFTFALSVPCSLPSFLRSFFLSCTHFLSIAVSL